MPTTSVEDLIKAGPTSDKAPSNRIAEAVPTPIKDDDKPIKLDIFDKVRDGIDPALEETLKKEEEKAAKDEEKEKADKIKSEELEKKPTAEEAVDKVLDEKGKETPVTKKEDAKPDDSLDSLIHLELGISPGALVHFKNMNKAAKDWISSELKTRYQKITELQAQNKELAEKRPSSGDGNNLSETWYEHPAAVNLLPEYQQAVTTVSRAHELLDHYRNQKIAIIEGDNWEDIVVGEDGKASRREMKPNAHAQAYVDKMILDASQAIQQLTQKATEIKQNFQSNHLRSRESVVKLEGQYFPQYTDPKVLETNGNWKAFNAAIEKFGLKNDRMAGVTGKMYVYTMEMLEAKEAAEAKVKELEEKLSKMAGNGNRNGPTGDEINRGSNGSKKKYENPLDEPVDMDAFERLKNKGE